MRTRPLLVAACLVAVAAAVPLLTGAGGHPPRPRELAAVDSFGAPPIVDGGVQTAYSYVRGVALDRYFLGVAHARRPRPRGGGGCAPDDWECFRACTIRGESGGNYARDSGNGYSGAWQFDQSTWDSNAGASGRHDLVGTPPHQASPEDQDQIAHDTYQRRGKQPWGGRC